MVSSIAQLAHLFLGVHFYNPIETDVSFQVVHLEPKINSLHDHVISFVNALEIVDMNDFSYLRQLLEKLRWIQKKICKLEKKFDRTLGALFSFEVFSNQPESKALVLFRTRIHSDAHTVKQANHELYLKAKDEYERMKYPEDVVSSLKRYEIIQGFESNNANLLEQLAHLHSRLDNEKEAIFYYQKAVQQSPLDTALVHRYIEYLISIRKFTQATQELELLRGRTDYDCDSATLQKSLEVELGKGNFFESVTIALSGIFRFPSVDALKDRLVDAYILEMDRTESSIFKNNFFLIYHYFSTKSTYLQVARSSIDSVEIALDLFDYTVKRSFRIFPIFKKFIREYCRHEQSFRVIQEHMELHCEYFLERFQHMSLQIDDVSSRLRKKEFSSAEDVRFFAMSIRQLSENLLGGKLGDMSMGYIPVMGLYLKLLSKQNHIREYKTTFEPIYEKLKEIKKSFQMLLQRLNGIESQESIAALFTKKKNLYEAKSKPALDDAVDEISLDAWNRRLNLFRYIERHLIPIDFQDQATEYLESAGISLDSLFSSEFIDVCDIEPQEAYLSSRLHELFIRKKIFSIKDLKTYLVI